MVASPAPVTDIIVCYTCSGEGIVQKSAMGEHWTQKCLTCGGNGRLKRTTIIEYDRFDTRHPVPKARPAAL